MTGAGLAVLVNDLGSVNIDASLIRGELRRTNSEGVGGCGRVGQGCILLLLLQTETQDALLSLFEGAPRGAHHWVEATGVAAPGAFLVEWRFERAELFSGAPARTDFPRGGQRSSRCWMRGMSGRYLVPSDKTARRKPCL